MYCRNCGKEINGEAKFCPECGATQQSAGESARNDFHKENQSSNETDETKRQENSLEKLDGLNLCCIVGFIISVISLFFITAGFGIIGIVALVLSLIGRRQTKGQKGGSSIFAAVGIGISAVACILAVIYIINYYQAAYEAVRARYMFLNWLENLF